MSLKYNMHHLRDYVAWRSFCGWQDFAHLQLVGDVELHSESLKIDGVAAIFSNDYVKSGEYPGGWRYGKQPDERQSNVRSYLLDPTADRAEFEDDRDKLKANEVASVLCGSAASHKEWCEIVGHDKGLSLRDELTIEDFPKGYLLFGRSIASGEKVVILYHHVFIRPWFFWQHFVEGNLLPTTCPD